jgi:hypothetical protein
LEIAPGVPRLAEALEIRELLFTSGALADPPRSAISYLNCKKVERCTYAYDEQIL